jgi:hypothetical protein
MFAPISRNDLGNCFRLTLRPFYVDKLSRAESICAMPRSRSASARGLNGNSRRGGAPVIWRSLSRVCCGVVRSKTENTIG